MAKKIVVAADKPMTKSQLMAEVAEQTGVAKKDVGAVLEALGEVIGAHVKKSGPGAFTLPGLLKITIKDKPKVPRRKGINPFTGEEQWFAAKPASRQVKIKPLKALKDMAAKR